MHCLQGVGRATEESVASQLESLPTDAPTDVDRNVLPRWKIACARLWPAGVIILFDQVTKVWVQSSIEPGASVSIWGNWIIFTHQLNPAGAMSIRLGPPAFYLTITALVVVFLTHTIITRLVPPMSRWALTLILAGAVGNMIDRIRIGAVIDFVDLEFFDFSLPAIDWGPIHVPGDLMTRWPVFNVADASVSVGICLLILATFIFEREHGDSPRTSD